MLAPGGPHRKPRDVVPLILGIGVLLPASGLAYRYWADIASAAQQFSPLIQVSDRTSRPDRPSGLALVRPEPLGEPASAGSASSAQAAPPSSLDMIAKEPAGQEPPSQPPAQAQPPPAAPAKQRGMFQRRRVAKLQVTHGVHSWYQPNTGALGVTFGQTVQSPALGASQEGAQEQPSLPTAPTAPSAAAGRPSAQATSPRRAGFRPPPPVYQANPGATEVGYGGPTGEAQSAAGGRLGGAGGGSLGAGSEYTTFTGAPDTQPLPNPEGVNEQGACRRGWWKNGYDGRCYETRAACQGADYTHQGCTQ